MRLVMSPTQLRMALGQIEQAEGMGFDRCLAWFEYMEDTGRLEFVDLVERYVGPDGKLVDYGRGSDLTTSHRVVDRQLVEVTDPAELKALDEIFQRRHAYKSGLHERAMEAMDHQSDRADSLEEQAGPG